MYPQAAQLFQEAGLLSASHDSNHPEWYEFNLCLRILHQFCSMAHLTAKAAYFRSSAGNLSSLGQAGTHLPAIIIFLLLLCHASLSLSLSLSSSACFAVLVDSYHHPCNHSALYFFSLPETVCMPLMQLRGYTLMFAHTRISVVFHFSGRLAEELASDVSPESQR
ncbi:unnamed protein product [Polarella glacialis]|uniref:Uncharacterized protein n=1 Tax=Polarella glacialis TaxID=89957 RepID=A0A813DEA4_POLGL|nr:unnamed protein product [Polarella glacialis]